MIFSTRMTWPETQAGAPAPDVHRGVLAARRIGEWILPAGDEQFRAIYTRAGIGASDVLAVTSAIAGEGKSTVSLGLAIVIAQDFPGRQVLLVETDVEKPSLARDFGIDPYPGLVDHLLERRSLEPTYRPTLLRNLHLLPSGGPLLNPGRLLRSRSMAQAVTAMRAAHDLVILDLTSVLVNSDSVTVADLADRIIVVVRAGVTPISLVNKAINLLDEDKLRGVVLNGVHSSIPGWLRRLGRM